MSKQPKILIVEDEKIIAWEIQDTLISFGYDVPAIVSSGQIAMAKVAELLPDLVIMDVELEGDMDGVETAEQISTLFHTPIVYLTAHTDPLTFQRATKTAPYGYIVKPYDEQDLNATVAIALSRAKAEADIRKALEVEKELNELKSRFVTTVSHEFRTPLATILFSAGLLERYSDEWSAEKKKSHFERIEISVRQMASLLDDVLMINRDENSEVELQLSVIELDNFCTEIVEQYQTSSPKHEIYFSMTGMCDRAILDQKLVSHILHNLLSNAIKYSPAGGVINFDLTCLNTNQERKFVCNDDGVAIFRVRDEGIGIPPEDQPHLFELFHRSKNVGTISGTGLGLAIVKKAVDAHKGKISVDSEVGKGTVITVVLPLNLQAQI